jgi:predicted ATPase
MADEPVFVGREAELARLDELLGAALDGRGQVCFVSGEAGAGKTALLAAFSRRAEQRDADLVVALGSCDAQTGSGDAYLPFREVLDLLLGNAEARAAQGRISPENARRLSRLLILSTEVLVELGPDLIGLFVPGASLAAKVGKVLTEKSKLVDALKKRAAGKPAGVPGGAGEIQQAQIFEQYVNVIRGLSAKKPLVLVLDDLQWADAASIGLLFRLARRLDSARLLMVGTYRPNDLAVGREGERHPLEPVLAEIKRYQGEVGIDLDAARAERGRQFVDAYLETELRRADDALREALFRQTGGHPLFTVELVRDLKASGRLVCNDEGCWCPEPALDWTELPTRVEGVIEERIGRLAAELRQWLTVASVEGEQFTAEVIARVQSLDARALVARLSGELQREHRLVQVEGVQRLAGGRASRYRFAHNLVQTYLYGRLDEVERVYLHEDVGNALEALYGDQADQAAVQLARHFELAGVPDQARKYLRAAGEQAAARFAHAEALAYFDRTLAAGAPDPGDAARFELLQARERALDALGLRERQAQDLREMRALAARQADAGRLAYVALREAVLALATGRPADGAAAARESAALAVQAGDPLAESRAEHRWGRACWQAGEYEQAMPHLDAALRLAREQGSPLDEAQCLYDLGTVAYFRGDAPAALAHVRDAAALYEQAGVRQGAVRCLSLSGVVADATGDHRAAVRELERALALSREVGWRYGESRLLAQCANAYQALGDLDAARRLFEQAAVLCEEIEDREAAASSLDSLGLIAAWQGRAAEARGYYERALAAQRSAGDRRGEGYTLTHLGYALVELGDWAGAEQALEQALALRREAQAGGLVLDTLAGLALLAMARGDAGRAAPYASEMLAGLEANGPAGVEYPVQVYLACYRALAATGAAEAGRVLEAGHALVLERAGRLEDEPALRERFMRAVPFNAALEAEWRQARGRG